MDSREVQTKTTDPDPEQEGEEGEVITTTTEYFTNMSKVNVYDHTGGGNVIANGAAAAALGTGTFKLTDIRDQHPYIVRRLADGNCWMVENLDLELSTSGVLTPEDSDVSADWDPYGSSGGASNFETYSLTKIGTAQQYQYQPKGIYGPTNHWGSRLNSDGELLNGSNYSAANYIESYSSAGQIVENNGRDQIPRSYDNEYDYGIGKSLAGVAFSAGSDNGWNIDHASAYYGNYYNWYATTAESGTFEMTSGDAKDSLCPKGWGLPKGSTTAVNRSWTGLISSFKSSSGNNLPQDGNIDAYYSAQSIPLSFGLSGDYDMVAGNLNNKGKGFLIWSSNPGGRYRRSSYFSSTGNSSNNIYTFNTNNANPRASGFAVRCVAHGSELNSEASQEAVATTCAGGKICYDGNGGTGSMNDQSASANASVVLTAPTYTRLGYSFAGWSTQDNGFGTVYGPNETITTPSNLASTGLQLYAKWLPSTGTMQDFTTAQCNALGEHQSIALTDNRDGNTYTVTKLKDGNCWMTTNLALNLADFAGDNPKSGYLTTENTDIGNDTTNPRTDLIDVPSTGGGNSGVLRWDPALSSLRKAVAIVCPAVTNPNTKDAATLLTETNAACPGAITKDVSNNYAGGNYFEIVSENYLGQTQTTQFTADDQYGEGWEWGTKCDAVGSCDKSATPRGNSILSEMPRELNANSTLNYTRYFNWYAATAESGVYDISGVTVSDSVCPFGWDLPNDYSNHGGNGTWKNLMDAYGIWQGGTTGKREFAKLPISGDVTSGWLHAVTGEKATDAYARYQVPGSWQTSSYYFSSQDMSNNGTNKEFGYLVRCVKILMNNS